MLEQKYDALKTSCDKMEVTLKQLDKNSKEKEERRDVLEQKYDELKASCDKIEVVLKQLAVAQTKKNDKMDLILTKLMSSQLPQEDDLEKS